LFVKVIHALGHVTYNWPLFCVQNYNQKVSRRERKAPRTSDSSRTGGASQSTSKWRGRVFALFHADPGKRGRKPDWSDELTAPLKKKLEEQRIRGVPEKLQHGNTYRNFSVPSRYLPAAARKESTTFSLITVRIKTGKKLYWD
jgi:hypothetical protein